MNGSQLRKKKKTNREKINQIERKMAKQREKRAKQREYQRYAK